MKSTLSATHLMRQLLLFALTIIFLLTVVRAAYGLWQFPRLEETNAYVELFVQGLRFDLALVGLICLIPVALGTLFAIIKPTLPLAKFIITFFMIVGLVLILLLEMITPWFIHTQGVRPDINVLMDIKSPIDTLKTAVVGNPIPAGIAAVLCILILIAFWLRLENHRFLRYRVSFLTGLPFLFVGCLLCVVAIWSTPDLRKTAFSPADSLISADTTVNDLAMNTTYKFLYSLASPHLEKFTNASID